MIVREYQGCHGIVIQILIAILGFGSCVWITLVFRFDMIGIIQDRPPDQQSIQLLEKLFVVSERKRHHTEVM